MKANGRVDNVYACLMLTVDGGDWSLSHSSYFTTQEESPDTLGRRLGELSSQ